MSGLCAFADASVTGYEIHMGVSAGPAFDVPAFLIEGRGQGARSQDEAILGSYLHGMFDMPDACAALLRGVPGQRCQRQYGAAARSEP